MIKYIKKRFLTIIVTVILVITVIGGPLILLCTPLTLIKGTLTNRMLTCRSSDGHAYIREGKKYYAARGSIAEWNDKYHVDLELGDTVLILCEKSVHETAPTEIRILYLCEM